MKTILILMLLAMTARTARADEPANLLELLRKPGPAVADILGNGESATDTRVTQELERLERAERTTRSLTAAASPGGRLVALPGRRVDLR